MISVVTLYSTICVQEGIQTIALYGTYSCVSLLGGGDKRAVAELVGKQSEKIIA